MFRLIWGLRTWTLKEICDKYYLILSQAIRCNTVSCPPYNSSLPRTLEPFWWCRDKGTLLLLLQQLRVIRQAIRLVISTSNPPQARNDIELSQTQHIFRLHILWGRNQGSVVPRIYIIRKQKRHLRNQESGGMLIASWRYKTSLSTSWPKQVLSRHSGTTHCSCLLNLTHSYRLPPGCTLATCFISLTHPNTFGRRLLRSTIGCSGYVQGPTWTIACPIAPTVWANLSTLHWSSGTTVKWVLPLFVHYVWMNLHILGLRSVTGPQNWLCLWNPVVRTMLQREVSIKFLGSGSTNDIQCGWGYWDAQTIWEQDGACMHFIRLTSSCNGEWIWLTLFAVWLTLANVRIF